MDSIKHERSPMREALAIIKFHRTDNIEHNTPNK